VDELSQQCSSHRTTKASDASGISFDCGGCGEKMAGSIFRDIERLVATA
jgi:predicted RNA-binding Zn-ribbon protein involved in translation (DUF1610 family)